MSAAIVAAATGISRVAGLGREMLMGYYFGASGELSTFTSITVIPNLVNSLLADAAISAAFVPVFTRLVMQDRRERAYELASKMLSFIVAAVGAIVLALVVLAPFVVRAFFPKVAGDASLFDLSVQMMRVMMPTVLLLTSAGVVVGVLYSFERFVAPAFGAVVWNAVTIVFMVAFAPHWGIWALVLGTVAGTLGQFLLVVSALRGTGVRLRASFAFRDRELGRVLLLMVPVTLTLGILNFNALVNQAFAWLASSRGPSEVYYAFRLFQLPQGMFAISIGTVLFPSLSRFAAEDDMGRFRETLSRGVRQIFFVSLPFVVWFLTLSTPIVRLVYQRGEFTAQETGEVAGALAMFALGMLFANGSIMLNRGFQSLQRPWFPLYIGLGNLALNALLAWALVGPLGVRGVTLATAIVSTFNFFGLMWLMRRQLDSVDGRRIVAHLVAMSAGGAVLAAWSLLGWRVLRGVAGGGVLPLLAVLLGLVASGALLYAGVARALRLDEVSEVIGLLRRRGRTQPDPGEAPDLDASRPPDGKSPSTSSDHDGST